MKQLVIVSGKGGTGKTSITAALASLGPKKVLADCDVDAADLHIVLKPDILQATDFVSGETPVLDPDACVQCGQCLEHCRFDAISEDFVISQEHCEGCGVCAYVCEAGAIEMVPRTCGVQYLSRTRFGTMAHADLGIGEENSGKLVTNVRNAAAAAAEEEGAELVLVDGSPGVGCPVIASLTGADACLVVTEPTKSALHDLERILELTRHFDIPAMVLVNKAGVYEAGRQHIREHCERHGVPVVGELPYSPAVTQAQIHGQTLMEYDPHGLGRIAEDVWERIEPRLYMDQP
jgi:MinD superfamily P-loop ATPase